MLFYLNQPFATIVSSYLMLVESDFLLQSVHCNISYVSSIFSLTLIECFIECLIRIIYVHNAHFILIFHTI